MSGEPAHLVGTVKVCPRCQATDTKFRYNNNAKISQPRYLCNGCNIRFTLGGNIRKSKAVKLGGEIDKRAGKTRKRKAKAVKAPTTDRAGGADEGRIRRSSRISARRTATAMAQLQGGEPGTASSEDKADGYSTGSVMTMELQGGAADDVAGNLQPGIANIPDPTGDEDDRSIVNASSSGSAPAGEDQGRTRRRGKNVLPDEQLKQLKIKFDGKSFVKMCKVPRKVRK